MTDTFEYFLAGGTPAAQSVPLIPLTKEAMKQKGIPTAHQSWFNATDFKAAADSICLCPNDKGGIGAIYIGLGADKDALDTIWWLASAASKLPVGDYHLDEAYSSNLPLLERAALGWCLGQYRFDHYKAEDAENDDHVRRLHVPDAASADKVEEQYLAIALVRDLVNTPAEDMGPADLQAVAEEIAESFGGHCDSLIGNELLDADFPAIHAVGRAAAPSHAPRLIDLSWGDVSDPALTLVGKGVCFDTGGLDLKPSQFMRNMKKDMGGAAHVLGLACLIMAAELPVNLRVLIPAVENSVAGNAFRPGDILETRKGLSVEIGNTDAEGRLVLCDALTFACEASPDLLIDMATLTGAARVALGPDLPATFTDDDGLWQAIDAAQAITKDPVWRMPLWDGYDDMLKSPVADLCNVSDGSFAGAITAGLYLRRFVEKSVPWVHVDVFAWNPAAKAGRPVGGEAQSIRTLFEGIKTFLNC